jgi:hypothetical protein
MHEDIFQPYAPEDLDALADQWEQLELARADHLRRRPPGPDFDHGRFHEVLKGLLAIDDENARRLRARRIHDLIPEIFDPRFNGDDLEATARCLEVIESGRQLPVREFYADPEERLHLLDPEDAEESAS